MDLEAAAGRALESVEDDVRDQRPPIPAALFTRVEDFGIIPDEAVRPSAIYSDHGDWFVDWYGEQESLRLLREAREAAAAYPNDDFFRRRVERIEEIETAFKAWTAECETLANEFGLPETTSYWREANDACEVIFRQVAITPAATIEEAAFKAKVATWLFGCDAEEMVSRLRDTMRAQPKLEPSAPTLALLLAADVIRLNDRNSTLKAYATAEDTIHTEGS